jgi:putative FmdB family regulatory protein
MPLYDFGCPSCETRFEELQPLAAAPPRCPRCGGTQTERVIASFARPRPGGGRDPSWTPAATRSDAIGAGHAHHHH